MKKTLKTIAISKWILKAQKPINKCCNKLKSNNNLKITKKIKEKYSMK